MTDRYLPLAPTLKTLAKRSEADDKRHDRQSKKLPDHSSASRDSLGDPLMGINISFGLTRGTAANNAVRDQLQPSKKT
jgi:hypothetical protein